MPSRVVELPRDKAIQVAKYEQDSLLLRAKASAKCPELWHDAAYHAGLAVQCLRRGDDRGAVRHALHVAPRWKKAADCEGWPTPMGSSDTPLDPEQKLDLIIRMQREEARKRRFTLVIGALGALIAAAKLGIIAIPLVKAARQRRGGSAT